MRKINASNLLKKHISTKNPPPQKKRKTQQFPKDFSNFSLHLPQGSPGGLSITTSTSPGSAPTLLEVPMDKKQGARKEPPGKQHIPPWEKGKIIFKHFFLWMGSVSFQKSFWWDFKQIWIIVEMTEITYINILKFQWTKDQRWATFAKKHVKYYHLWLANTKRTSFNSKLGDWSLKCPFTSTETEATILTESSKIEAMLPKSIFGLWAIPSSTVFLGINKRQQKATAPCF